MTRPAQITIRQMVDTDLDKVLQIEENSYTNPWDMQSITDLFLGDNICSKVAVISRKVEGYNFYSVYPTYFQIINLTVNPLRRRRKVATRLIGDMFKVDQQNTIRNIDAWVNETKIPMLMLLKRHEFKAIGIAKYLFGQEDGYLMRFSMFNDKNIPEEYEDLLSKFDYISL